jgi:hypothetical protein
LLLRARTHLPAHPEVANCWLFITEGVALGWLDREELSELIQFLKDCRDWTVEELSFSHLGSRLRVSMLGDEASCDPRDLAAALSTLLEDVQQDRH